MSDQSKKNKVLVLFVEQKGLCYYCKTSLYEEARASRTPQIDHKISKFHNGTNEKANLCLTCRSCNSSKKTKSDQEFMLYLQPYFDGKCSRKDLNEYNKYQKLKEKYEATEN